jgi:Porin subfamily
MTRKRTIGRVAAIGGLTATVALLTGLAAASADELADLRANQELLQRRIDQLAQGAVPRGGGVPGAYGTEAVPGQPLAGGSFPRSFLIPGTDTSIRIGGFIDETLDLWLTNGPPNGTATTTVGATGNVESMTLNNHGQAIPGLGAPATATPGFLGFGSPPAQVGHSRGIVFTQSPRETRLNVETRTPTAWGESRTFIEFDFAGGNNFSTQNALRTSDSLIPRLRYAYGTLGGFLVGQANSNFSDPDANPETLDFGGPAGFAGVTRIPQVRYTVPGPGSSAWSVSAESPNTDLITPAGLVAQDTNSGALPGGPGAPTTGFTYLSTAYGPVPAGTALGTNPAKNSAPDVTLASYWSQPWGHVDFRLVGRLLEVNDGRFFNKEYFGYGGGISGDVKPGWFGWAKDDFQWQFTAGEGIGHYLNATNAAGLATNYLSTPASALIASRITFKPITAFGFAVGYQHFWLPNLRSTAVYGYSYWDIASNLIGPSGSATVNKQLQTAHLNLIWSPVAFIDAGLEYMWGQRKVVANIYGNEQVVISKFRVKF